MKPNFAKLRGDWIKLWDKQLEQWTWMRSTCDSICDLMSNNRFRYIKHKPR